eukprot:gene9978-181_t
MFLISPVSAGDISFASIFGPKEAERIFGTVNRLRVGVKLSPTLLAMAGTNYDIVTCEEVNESLRTPAERTLFTRCAEWASDAVPPPVLLLSPGGVGKTTCTLALDVEREGGEAAGAPLGTQERPKRKPFSWALSK